MGGNPKEDKELALNNWNAIGRLTKDAETRTLPDGTALVSFDLAVDTGNKQKPDTLFIQCTAFGKTSEIISQYAGTKGTQVGINARLRLEKWQDKESGANRSKISCVVERITLLGSKRDSSDQSPSQYTEESSQAGTVGSAVNGFDGSREVDPTADIPF